MMQKIRKETFLQKSVKIFYRYWLQVSILAVLVLGGSFFFPGGKSLQLSYKLNDITRKPIISPFTFPILKTEKKLQDDLNKAINSEPFVFIRKQEIVDNGIEKVHDFFQIINEIHEAEKQVIQSKDLVYRYRYEPQHETAKADYIADSTAFAILTEKLHSHYSSFPLETDLWKSFTSLPSLENEIYPLTKFEEDVVQICRNHWAEGIYDIRKNEIVSKEVMVHQGDVPEMYQPGDFIDLEEAWTKAKVEVTNLFPDENDFYKTIGYDLIVEFMKPNLIYDKETTERRQTARLSRVYPNQGTVLKDERIVDVNTRINEDILQKLNSLSTALVKKEGTQSGWEALTVYLGKIIIIAVVISFFFTFLFIYRTPIFDDWKMVLLMALIFFAEMGLSYVFGIKLNISPYLIPITVAAMSLTILFDARIGFMGTTSMVILTGIMIGNDLDFIVVALFTSGVAMYNVRQLRNRSQVFATIFALIAASIIVAIGIGFFKGSSWVSIRSDIFYLIIISILAPIVTYGLIGLLEGAFKITTDLTLLELLDFDHPLLKRLLQNANGTFNHSIVVGNLAEACANAIGARSLLARVGAYYHDIGKLARPEYFIENQYSGINKHDSLPPAMSAKIIKNHVKEGSQLAKEYGLPKIIRDFIPMHHGTTRVEYFYRRALEIAEDSTEVDENAFRYPGPKPDTKETGILMICEAVEAAVRSIKNPDIMKIEAMIDKIIKGRLDDEQLDECPLTLGELTKIKGKVDGTEGMLPVLRGIYHIRVEYPDDPKEETEGQSHK